MGHHHGNAKNLQTAFFLNLGFTLFEIVGALLTNSVAILSDALHDLGDSVSLGVSWFLDRYSEREGDKQYSYGYRRFSLLGALINSLILVVGGIYVLFQAIPRLLEPEATSAPGMIFLAVIGVVVNGVAAMRLRDASSLNVQVVSWHLLEDVLGWVAVLVVGITLVFVDLPILDPILSIAITAYVSFNVLNNLRKTLAVFLQATPHDIDLANVQERLLSITGVQSTHHTHVWSLDGEHNVLTTHLVVADDMPKDEYRRVKQEAKTLIDDLHLEHITVEIEYGDEDCQMKADVLH